MKNMLLPKTQGMTRKTLLAVAALVAGMLLDTFVSNAWPPVSVAWPVGLVIFMAIGVIYVLEPLLVWNSAGALQTAFDGAFSLGRIVHVRGDLPLVVLAAGSLNVPLLATVTKAKDFVLTVPQLVERFGRNLLLYSRVYPARKDFSDLPEVADALRRAGYSPANPEHNVHLAVWGVLEPDISVRTLDLKAFSLETVKDLDEAKEMARTTLKEVERRASTFQSIRRRAR